MSISKRTLLQERSNMLKVLNDLDKPHHLKVLAKVALDKLDVALGLRDAALRKASRQPTSSAVH